MLHAAHACPPPLPPLPHARTHTHSAHPLAFHTGLCTRAPHTLTTLTHVCTLSQWALKLQIWIYEQRFRTLVHALRHVIETGEGAILDRSAFSDRVFADANLEDGNISQEGYDHYLRLRTQSLASLPCPWLTIYLVRTPPPPSPPRSRPPAVPTD
jgi:hypothetical protein